ncbi:putative transcriptional regulator of N-Acetylglucosamine utilization, GntR family [Serinicoccus hydrothermalis]|uniref:Putative transcriptional regulator of N-Acetylglucosamine utilization, GntR family n=1 Tax=Serinicoccus hydrothermalis TaxID=1758689 RepID=A0A1B1N8D8_9MICO|nr:putative transcriptional regulator of N-Acetylglucosamine utilization, GntR family [Serinicoccus hydrothermalis]
MATLDGVRLDRTSAQPLWAQLHADLLRRLEAGEFTRGFPAEGELREEYAVSRHTVREALRRIRAAGLVRSGRGRRSEVLATTIEQPLGGLYSMFAEVEARGMRQTSRVLSCGVTREVRAAQALGLPPQTDLFGLQRLRLADDVPLAHDCVWMPASLAGDLVGTDFTRTALYEELERHGVARPDGGYERIAAAVLDDELAELLEVDPPAAGLVIERTGTLQGSPVECRRTTVRADRYALTLSFDADGFTVGR